MIVWSGYGFLTVFLGLGGIGAGAALGGTGLAEGYGLGLGLVLAAALNWFAGTHFNNPARARELIDSKTGQRVILRRNHTLFWIPMQWWSLAFAAIALTVLAMQASGNLKPGTAMARMRSSNLAIGQSN